VTCIKLNWWVEIHPMNLCGDLQDKLPITFSVGLVSAPQCGISHRKFGAMSRKQKTDKNILFLHLVASRIKHNRCRQQKRHRQCQPTLYGLIDFLTVWVACENLSSPLYNKIVNERPSSNWVLGPFGHLCNWPAGICKGVCR